jgi:hypothetical protein
MFDNIFLSIALQATVGALAQVMDFARTHRSTDSIGWDNVIDALNQVLTFNDMKKIVTRSNASEVREGFEEPLDRDVFHTWKASFVGIFRYHVIPRGVSGRFHHEEVFERPVFPEHYDPDESDEDEDLVSGHQYYLVYQMMSAYYHWLRLHPAAEAVFMRGFVVSASFVFHIHRLRMNLTPPCKVILSKPLS